MRDLATDKPSVGKIIICSLIALFIGLIQPFSAMFQIMMPLPTLSLAAMIGVALYVIGGIIPAAILGVIGAASSMFFLEIVPGAVLTLLWIPPAAFIIAGIQTKKPFFQQMARGIAFTISMTVAALLILALIYGNNLIGIAVEQLRLNFDAQRDLLWEAVSPVLQAYGSITKEAFLQSYYDMFRTVQAYYELYLMSNLLTGAILTAGLAVLWGNWLAARRGRATVDSYRDPTQWFLPANITFGLLLLLLGGWIYVSIAGLNAQPMWIVIVQISTTLFFVQGLTAFSRRLKMGGAEGRQRTLILILLIIASNMLNLNGLIALAGAASALFGSKGALRPWINKFNNHTNG